MNKHPILFHPIYSNIRISSTKIHINGCTVKILTKLRVLLSSGRIMKNCMAPTESFLDMSIWGFLSITQIRHLKKQWQLMTISIIAGASPKKLIPQRGTHCPQSFQPPQLTLIFVNTIFLNYLLTENDLATLAYLQKIIQWNYQKNILSKMRCFKTQSFIIIKFRTKIPCFLFMYSCGENRKIFLINIL